MRKCINYDKHGNSWTEEPQAFRNVGCIGCNTYNNDIIVANDGTKEYEKTMEKLFDDQFELTGVKRTLSTDYVKNLAYYKANEDATWVNPNMKTFDASKGYLKLCVSFAMSIARIPQGGDLKQLGKPITDWDRCGMYDIWTA